jgi:small subunit ribosomal protein S9
MVILMADYAPRGRGFRRPQTEYVEDTKKEPTKQPRKKLTALPKSLENPVFIKAKKGKVLHVSSKRKSAIGRASVKSGKGRIVINKVPYTLITNKYILDMVREPLMIVEEYKKDLLNKIDIEIVVNGGGQMGQSTVARNCIARAFVQFFDDVDLAEKIMVYNRSFLVDDVRRVESKKPLGPKARAKKQHSKR